jgi:hypothetical protein
VHDLFEIHPVAGENGHYPIGQHNDAVDLTGEGVESFAEETGEVSRSQHRCDIAREAQTGHGAADRTGDASGERGERDWETMRL